MSIRTAQQIVDECNELATSFYERHGYVVRDGYKFYEAHHPQEVLMWELAVAAYDHVEGTDVESCLDEIMED